MGAIKRHMEDRIEEMLKRGASVGKIVDELMGDTDSMSIKDYSENRVFIRGFVIDTLDMFPQLAQGCTVE